MFLPCGYFDGLCFLDSLFRDTGGNGWTEPLYYIAELHLDGGGTIRVRVCFTEEMLGLYSRWRLLATVHL